MSVMNRSLVKLNKKEKGDKIEAMIKKYTQRQEGMDSSSEDDL